MFTLTGILEELREPGRDPRDKFVAPSFKDSVKQNGDLREGMTLEGVVTNVTKFGAFVDVGVHQDGRNRHCASHRAAHRASHV